MRLFHGNIQDNYIAKPTRIQATTRHVRCGFAARWHEQVCGARCGVPRSTAEHYRLMQNKYSQKGGRERKKKQPEKQAIFAFNWNVWNLLNTTAIVGDHWNICIFYMRFEVRSVQPNCAGSSFAFCWLRLETICSMRHTALRRSKTAVLVFVSEL